MGLGGGGGVFPIELQVEVLGQKCARHARSSVSQNEFVVFPFLWGCNPKATRYIRDKPSRT